MSSAPLSDLMALATIRRMLLELGIEMHPEVPGMMVGPLEVWMRKPCLELGGVSPLAALQTPGGTQRVRECLAALAADGQSTMNDRS